MQTEPLLEQYVRSSQNRSSQNRDVEDYCRMFTAISEKVFKPGSISSQRRGGLFLQGLPRNVSDRVIEKCNTDWDDPSYDYAKMLKVARDNSNAECSKQRIQEECGEITRDTSLAEEFARLREHPKTVTLRSPVVHQQQSQTPQVFNAVDPEATSKPGTTSDAEMDDLVKQLKAFRLDAVQLSQIVQSTPEFQHTGANISQFRNVVRRAAISAQPQYVPPPAAATRYDQNQAQMSYDSFPHRVSNAAPGTAPLCYECPGPHKFYTKCPQLV